MKWFGDQAAIKWTDFYVLTGSRQGTVTDWVYIELVGEAWDNHSYHVLRHKPTGKLYRTCWGSIAPNGKMRPYGQYDPERDYNPLQEVRAVQATEYEDA